MNQPPQPEYAHVVRAERTDLKNFLSGAQRSNDAEQEAYHLISPAILESLARISAEGAQKYGEFNWEKGMPASDLLNHALRHWRLFSQGDFSEDHLGHMLWNIGAAIHSIRCWPHLNIDFLHQLDERRIALSEKPAPPNLGQITNVRPK